MAQARVKSRLCGRTDRNIPGYITANVDLPNSDAVVVRSAAWFVFFLAHHPFLPA